MNNTIKIENIVKYYGSKLVLRDINIKIKQGECVGILGPNGAGKSTTFYIVLGLIKPTNGSIYFNEKKINNLPMYKRARLGIGYLAQTPSIFHNLSVEENILAILQTLKISKKEQKLRLDELLSDLDLVKLAKQKAYTLSGGERRKLEITRALVTNPSFLLLDEPFAGVDPLAVADIQKIIMKLKDKGIGVLVTDHNVVETLKIVERAYIVFNGKILFSGTSNNLVKDKKAREVYLGNSFSNYELNS